MTVFSPFWVSLFFSDGLHKNTFMQTVSWILLAQHWLLRSCGISLQIPVDWEVFPPIYFLTRSANDPRNRQGHKFRILLFKASSEFGLHTIFTIAWKIKSNQSFSCWLTAEDSSQTFIHLSVWIVTVGEFTRLDPESCIAGEDGRSECGRGGRSQILGTFFFTDWLAVKKSSWLSHKARSDLRGHRSTFASFYCSRI